MITVAEYIKLLSALPHDALCVVLEHDDHGRGVERLEDALKPGLVADLELIDEYHQGIVGNRKQLVRLK